MRLLGFIILLAALALGFTSPFMLIDAQSFIFVVGLTTAGLIASFGRDASISAVFSRSPNRQAILLGIAACERGKSIALISGMLGVFVGLVIMLNNMDDPSALGPGMAICILTMLYGLILGYGVFLPLCAGLWQKLEESEE